ncbi:MAG: tetratricopeptide repeat protein [Thermoanaerobaculia bacterium]
MNVRHPDRNAFERFSRGGASAAEERWIEDHLRSGCPVCQEEVDDLLLRSFAPPDEETAEQDAAWDRLFAGLGVRLARAAAERKEAPALLDELLGRPWEEWPVLFRLDRRLQTVAVCELLIEKSFEEGFRDAGRAIDLADRGLLLAGLLEDERYGRAVVQDLQARAWAYLGNARRIAFDLAGAEEALARAERLAEGGSADPLEEARILDLRASLLSDQGHFEKAAELLDAVIDIYDDVHEPHRKGRAMISKGRCLGYAGWHDEAIRQIRLGLSLVDWEREPRLVLMARHNLVWFLNDCGRADEARRLLERFRHTYRDFPDSFTGLRLAWLDGRIAARLGRFEEAETALLEVRRRFLAEENGYDASLVTLDLAHLYLEAGRAAEVRTLAAEMLDVFLSHDIHRQALAALAVFQKAAELDNATPGLVREISSYLVRARKNPELRFAKAAA